MLHHAFLNPDEVKTIEVTCKSKLVGRPMLHGRLDQDLEHKVTYTLNAFDRPLDERMSEFQRRERGSDHPMTADVTVAGGSYRGYYLAFEFASQFGGSEPEGSEGSPEEEEDDPASSGPETGSGSYRSLPTSPQGLSEPELEEVVEYQPEQGQGLSLFSLGSFVNSFPRQAIKFRTLPPTTIMSIAPATTPVYHMKLWKYLAVWPQEGAKYKNVSMSTIMKVKPIVPL
jgi:hypothetical protein